MDLSTINFSVNTKPLEAAAAAIGELVTNVGKLDKAARDAAQTEAVLAKAAKLNADANLQNAKAQDVRLKSTIAADKADQQATAAIEKKTKATERASTAIKKNADMLQLQNDTYDFILEGFSKGDAKVLAMAKATGQLSDQLKQVLTDIRQFSKNTFDQTETGLDRMVKSAKEAGSAQGFLNNGLNLTSKQAKELSNDLDRLNIRLQHQGKSYQEITKEQAIYKQRFVEEANAVNSATSALAAVEKQRKDVVSATNYLTQADQKMAAALNTSNAALDKAGTDSLVNYETALRKSGISQDVATAKLAKYKAQLEQVQIQEQKRREEHLTRALAPQATDVVVSLWSGQNPLTVLLQQGGQVTDLFMRSGVAAEKFGEVVKSSMKSMLPSILTVVKGVGGLMVDGLMAAGSAITGFIAKITLFSAASDVIYKFLASDGPSVAAQRWSKFSDILANTAAVGFAAVITAMAVMAVEYKKIIQSEGELSRALATSGGAMGLSKDQAVAYAQSMNGIGVGTLKAMDAITEFTKVGKIGKEGLDMIIKSAVDLEKYAGVPISETAKKFSELQDEPTKALIKFAESNGYVSASVLDTVASLEQQGDKAKAATVATEAMRVANLAMAKEAKDNLSPIEQLWLDIKSAVGSVKQEIYDLATSNAVVGALRTVWETVAVVISEVWFTIKGVGKEIGGIGAQIAAVMQGDFSGAAEIGRQMKLDAASAAEEQEKYVEAILNRTNVEQKSFNQSKEQNSQYAKWRKENDQALDKSISKTDKYKVKELEMQKAVLAGTVSQIEADKALAGWKKIILGEEKTKKDPSENYYATLMREATASSIKAEDATKSLTASQVKLLETVNDPRFLKLSKVQQETYLSTMAANVATEQQTALTEKLAEAEEHRLKLLGKSEGIGKQYYADMKKLEEFAKVAGWSREEIEELTRAVFKSTPAWRAYEKALEDVKSAARKFNEDSIASQAATLKESESLDYRLSLLGKTAEEQRALSIEYNRANKISEVRIKLAKQLRDIEADIEKAKKAGLPEEDYENLIDAQVQARKDAAEQEKVINREVAVQYREDFQREFIDPIRDGLTDSIVTALFEGGKAGSKKLRDLVMAELRKPVTMVVNAVVNTVLGSVVGSLMGGSANEATGGDGLVGTVSNISSAYRAATGFNTGWLTDFGSTMPGSIASTGANLYSQGFETVGRGMMDFGNSIAEYADAINVAGDVLGYGASIFAAANGKWGQAIGSAVGTYFGGPIGSFIGSTIGGLADEIFSGDAGTYHTGGAASYSAATGRRNSLGFRDNEEGLPSYNPNDNIDNQFGLGFGYVETGKETISAMETLSKSLVEIFDGIAKTFGKTAGYEVAVAFADDTSEDGAWGAFGVRLQGVEILNWDDFRQSKWAPKEFGDGEEGYKQYLAAVAKDTRKILTDMDIPGWAKTILKDIGENPSMEALSGAIQLLAQVETVFKSFGQYMPQFANLADSAKEALIKASGGVGALTSNMSSFVNAFYTDADKLEINTRNVTDAITALGFTMPRTREEFKALVESQMALGESGAANVASLLALSNAMNGILPAFGAVEEVIVGMSDTLRSLKEESNSLEIELLRLQGKNPEADARQRQTDTAGMSEAEVAAYDYNRTIREQIEALKRLAQLQQQSTSLEIELLRVRGQSAEADARQRAIDITGMSEAEVAAYDYNRTLREQIEVLQRLSQLQQQSTSLEIELLRAKGLTVDADARQRVIDIAGMSEAEVAVYDYNRTLREQIEALKRLTQLQQQSTSLEIELLRARGLTAEADARQRQLDTSGFSEAEIVAYDYNQSLREQIRVLQQLNELQQQSTSLEIELLRARGLTAEADVRQRELEISGMTAAQVALYDYNRALRGQIDSIRAAASAMDGLSNIRFDLENQLLTTQGNTTEVDRRTRERDLAGLTSGLTAEQAAAVTQAYDYNNVLREQVRAQEEANRAAQQAADAASQAAQQAADAAKSVRDAWQSITDSIMEEVKRIRNIVRGEDSQSLAYYQQQFAVKTAAARSGDQDASKLLPELSKTLLDLAELNATSYFELQLYRSRTAASLEETARILSGAYGTTLPSFDVGTNYVTKDMTARIHQGEAILPKAFNPWAGGSLPSNAGDSEKMSYLEDKLVTLANTVTTIAISTNKINRLLERVSRDGDALQVSVVS